MAELRAALTPGDDLAAAEVFADFLLKLVVAGKIVVDDFAVVEDGLDFLRRGFGAKGERRERRAARMAGKFFAREKTGSESSAGVSGYGLDVDIFEAAAEFEGADEKDVGKDSAGEAEFVGSGFAAEICGERDDEFFEEILRTARDVGASGGIKLCTRFGKTGIACKSVEKKCRDGRDRT